MLKRSIWVSLLLALFCVGPFVTLSQIPTSYAPPIALHPIYVGQVRWFPPGQTTLYWNSSTPVLQLVGNNQFSAGEILFDQNYSGGTISFSILGTFSSSSSGTPADGFTLIMFASNSNLPNDSPSDATELSVLSVMGDVLFPNSTTPYLAVQWDPYWTVYGRGEFNALFANPQGGRVSSNDLSVLASGEGNGSFVPGPDQLINFTVTYGDGKLEATAVDLNTGEEAQLSIGFNYTFLPGSYKFGVNAGTGSYWANWGLLGVSVSQSVPKEYSLTFESVGLPQGLTWGVRVQSEEVNSSSQSIQLNLPAGTYSFEVLPPGGMSPSPTNGTLHLEGDTTVVVRWSVLYHLVNVTFYGLPPGLGVNVEVGNRTFLNYSYVFNVTSGHLPLEVPDQVSIPFPGTFYGSYVVSGVNASGAVANLRDGEVVINSTSPQVHVRLSFSRSSGGDAWLLLPAVLAVVALVRMRREL